MKNPLNLHADKRCQDQGAFVFKQVSFISMTY